LGLPLAWPKYNRTFMTETWRYPYTPKIDI
jgi:hypothetical protein